MTSVWFPDHHILIDHGDGCCSGLIFVATLDQQAIEMTLLDLWRNILKTGRAYMRGYVYI
jgi:hypothetical protein